MSARSRVAVSTVVRFVDQCILRCLVHQIERAMNEAELNILRMFRVYEVEADQMLFFQSGFGAPETEEFSRTIQSMIGRGFVVRERRRGAYSLTSRGYRESRKNS
jgi:hypothetical protein